MKKARLDGLLAKASGLSRSQARDAIRAGRVSVDGQVVKKADLQISTDVALSLQGHSLSIQSEMHLMLHKPLGVLTAARDSRASTVMDLLPKQAMALGCMPIGRLDKDSSGLLLLSTDGELAHRLLAPRRKVDKLYEALVSGRLDAEDQAAFLAGIQLVDFTCLPTQLDIIAASDLESLARVTLHEGKHRQVRRMFGARGHEVLSLRRLRFGPIALDEALQPGEYRALSQEELHQLKEEVGLV